MCQKLPLEFCAQIKKDWSAVQKLPSGGISRAIASGWLQESIPENSYNLPFFLAYAVLDQVLDEMIDQCVFKCSSKNRLIPLGIKMEDSRNVLPWQDYKTIFEGKEARNDLAHKAQLLSKTECLKYIEGIERELHAWGLI
jgi:hypothetical protein